MSQALELMFVGMGFVFVFLTVLVLVTTLISKIILRLQPEEPVIDAPVPVATPMAGHDPQLLAVITAAIAKYRSRHKK